MASGKERTYYKAVRRAITAVISGTSLKEKLTVIVRGTARSMKAGVSLVLLDAGGTKLIHSTSWGLHRYYLQKGMPDADKSLSEVTTGKTVIIEDITKDSRIQYRQMAVQVDYSYISPRLLEPSRAYSANQGTIPKLQHRQVFIKLIFVYLRTILIPLYFLVLYKSRENVLTQSLSHQFAFFS